MDERNFCVNRRNSLCDVLTYVSAQFLDILDLAKKILIYGLELILELLPD